MELWLAREHFELSDPYEHVGFQVRSAFDVVAGAGWRITLPFQLLNEFWLVREGSVEISLGERTQIIHAPSVALLPIGTGRDTRHIAGRQLSILGFSFDARLWGALDFVRTLDLPFSWPLDVTPFEPLLSQMINETRGKRAGYSLAVAGLAQLAFVELLRSRPQGGEGVRSQIGALARYPELSRALELAGARFDEPLSVSDMARAAHLSPKHFGAKFRMALGLTPMEFLRSVRLHRARDLLASGADGVATISRRTGFEAPAHFSRAFKREFGVSPKAFRRSLGRQERESE